MKKVTVLIPSAGFASIDLLDHLQSHPEGPYRIVLADVNPNLPSKYLADAFAVSPRSDEDNYLDFILNVCERENVQVILPGKSADALIFSENKDVLKSAGVSVVVSDYSAVRDAVDKAKSFEIARNLGIEVPESFEVRTVQDFEKSCVHLGFPQHPICIKPSLYPSESGRGFRILDPSVNIHHRMFWEQPSELFYVSKEAVIDAMIYENEFPPQLVMEYLPDEEYSIYCFCEKGTAVYTVINRRISLYQMSTLEAVVESNDEIKLMAEKICAAFGFDYCVNIQIKYSVDRKPKLVEINPRIAGTIMLPVMAGIDMVHFGIQKSLGKAYPKGANVKIGTRIKRELTAKYYDY